MVRSSAAANVFTAIADPTRRDILQILSSGERSVGQLLERFAASQSAISQHLAVLRRAGLVTMRPEGRRRIYRVEPLPLREVADWIAYFERFWDEKLEALGEYLERDDG